MKTYSIAAIPGDGIGREVVPAATAVLEAVAARAGFRFEWQQFDWGSQRYFDHGQMMPADATSQLERFDAIFFGAVGDPRIQDNVTLNGLLLPIRRAFDQYACVRPAASSGAAPYCTGSEVSYTSKFGSTLTVRFGARDGNSTYVCGQYANGDFWVLGKGSPRAVVVASTSPARTGSGGSLRNGYAVNPGTNVNSYDGRVIGSQDPPALPLTLTTGANPISFVTSMSATSSDSATSNHPCQDDATNSRACRQFQHVVTFVDATPTNSFDLFRPGFAGPRKAGTQFRVSQIAPRIASLPSLDPVPSVSTWSLQDTADRFRWLHPFNSNGCGSNKAQWCAQEGPRDNFRPSQGTQTTNYGGSISLTNATAILRLFVKDFDRSIPRGSVSRAAAVGAIQVGIDTYSAMLNGATTHGLMPCLSAHGSAFVGRKVAPTFAAWAFNDSEMKAFIAEGTHFHEDGWAYYGADGVALQGFAPPYASCDDRADNCTMNGDIASWCRPGGRKWDAMCCGVKNYPSANSNSAPWNALIVKLLGAESIWNDPAYLDFAWRWREGRHRDGSGAVGPKMYCGPNNHMGNDGQTKSTAQMASFPADMWDRYKNLTSTVSPPPDALPPPTQIVP